MMLTTHSYSEFHRIPQQAVLNSAWSGLSGFSCQSIVNYRVCETSQFPFLTVELGASLDILINHATVATFRAVEAGYSLRHGNGQALKISQRDFLLFHNSAFGDSGIQMRNSHTRPRGLNS
jgi:hypothetical protein